MNSHILGLDAGDKKILHHIENMKGVKQMDKNSLYILKVQDDGEIFEYQYGNYKHAKEHYDNEKTATLYEYNNDNYYYVESKQEQYNRTYPIVDEFQANTNFNCFKEWKK